MKRILVVDDERQITRMLRVALQGAGYTVETAADGLEAFKTFEDYRPDLVINPVKIAEAFYYLHTQDRSCWTHELHLTPFAATPSH